MAVRRWPLGVLALSATFAAGAPGGAAPAAADASADEPPSGFVLTSEDSFVAAGAWEARNDYMAAQAVDSNPFQPVFTDGGFTTFGERSYGDYIIRLATSTEGDIGNYRDEAQQLVNEINASNGLSLQLAAATVAGPANPLNLGAVIPTGEIWLMITATSPCGQLSEATGSAGCGGPTGGAVIDGVFRWTEGAVYIRPGWPVEGGLAQVVVSHEIGHALGLDHFDVLFEGNPQVMYRFAQGNGVLKSGDLNGVNWLSGPLPSNDSPSGAAAVCPGDSSVSASTWFARKDAGESAHAGVGPRRSVWYRFQPRAEQNGGTATITTAHDGIDDFDTVLAVYVGASPTTPVTSNNDSGGGTVARAAWNRRSFHGRRRHQIKHQQITPKAAIPDQLDIALNLFDSVIVIAIEIPSNANQSRGRPVDRIGGIFAQLFENQPLEILSVVHQPVEVEQALIDHVLIRGALVF